MNATPQFIQQMADRAVSPEELEQHIQDCAWHMELAYARFQAHGDPHDRDAALQWMHLHQEAIRQRSPAAQAARHAAFEQRLDAGLDYFNSHHAQALGVTVRRLT